MTTPPQAPPQQPPLIAYREDPALLTDQPGFWSRLGRTWAAMFVAAIVLAGGTFVCMLLMAGFGGLVGPLLVFLFFVILKHIGEHVRQQRGEAVLRHVAMALRLNIPLPSLLYAAARSEPRGIARRLTTTADYLTAGYPIGRAVSLAAPEVADRVAGLLHAGEGVSRLPQVISAADARNQRTPRRSPDAAVFYRFYVMMLLAGVFVIIPGIMVFVVPKFREILADFRVSMPPISAFMFDIADHLREVMLPLVIFGILLILFLLARTLLAAFLPSRPYHLTAALRDKLLWYLPVTHAMQLHRGLADVFLILHQATSAGLPLHHAVASACRLDLNAVFRQRTQLLAARLNAGQPLTEALPACGFPPMVTRMLANAQTAANLPAATDFLARYYASRYSRTLIFLQAATIPVTVLFAGFIVLFVVLAIFVPMIDILDATAAGVPFTP